MNVNHWKESLAGPAGFQHVDDGSSSAIMPNTADGQVQSPMYSGGLQAAKMVEAILFAQPNTSLQQPSMSQSMVHNLMRVNERSHRYEQHPEFLELLREIEQMTYQMQLKKRPKLRLSSLIAQIIEEEQTGELGSRYEQAPGARHQLLRDLEVMVKLAHQKKISPQSQQRLCEEMKKMIAKAPKGGKRSMNLEQRKEYREKKKQLKQREKQKNK